MRVYKNQKDDIIKIELSLLIKPYIRVILCL